MGSGKIIVEFLATSADGDIVLLYRMLIAVHVVVPVIVAVVDPLFLAIPYFLDYPRAVRVLSDIVHTGQQFHHVPVCIFDVVGSGLCLPEFVVGIDGPVTSGFIIRRGRRFFPAPSSAETHRCLSIFRLTFLGGHEDDTEGCTGAVDRCCGSVLDDGNRFDIVGIHSVEISDGTIDEDERIGITVVDGSDTADIDLRAGTRSTGSGRDVQSRDCTLQHVRHGMRSPVFQGFRGDCRDGAGQVHLLLCTVTDHNRFFQGQCILLEDDGQIVLGRRYVQ